MGPAQGERLLKPLRTQPWNKAFGHAPVRRQPRKPLVTSTLHDDLTLTVLGPTSERLHEPIDDWKDEVHSAIDKGKLGVEAVSAGLEALGSANPPVLIDDDDLVKLALEGVVRDPSKANGSSIVLLLEYRERKMLLTGDAYCTDLVEGILAVSPNSRLWSWRPSRSMSCGFLFQECWTNRRGRLDCQAFTVVESACSRAPEVTNRIRDSISRRQCGIGQRPLWISELDADPHSALLAHRRNIRAKLSRSDVASRERCLAHEARKGTQPGDC